MAKGWRTKIEDPEERLRRRQEALQKYSDKTRQIKFYITPKDYNSIKSMAKKEAKSVAAFCKDHIMAKLGKTIVPKINFSSLGKINKIGKNINQIQKHFNIHGISDQTSIIEFTHELEEMNNILNDICIELLQKKISTDYYKD